MQAVAENTRIEQKKRHPVLVFFLVLLLLLCALAAGGYWYYFIRVHPQYWDLSGYTDMPVDAAGNNMIGNIPENLQAGGFMAGQNGWIYYANFSDNGALYMCSEDGSASLKLTDFPVANINMLEGTLVFTGLERRYTLSQDNVVISAVSKYNITEAVEAQKDELTVYGGKLYTICGLHEGGELQFNVIDEENIYYAPYLDKDGLFAFGISDGQSVFYNKTRNMDTPIGKPGEVIVRQYVHGGVIYLELRNGSQNRIMRIDKRTLWPVDYIEGKNLCANGTGFVFQGKDNFIYEISSDGYSINPISTIPMSRFEPTSNGSILAYTDTGWMIPMTKVPYDKGIPGKIANLAQKVVRQNGWYNYFNARQQLFPYSDKTFSVPYKVNGDGYIYGQSTWIRFKNFGNAGWLNYQSESAVAKAETFLAQEQFNPTWADPEDVNGASAIPDSLKDFGSEVDNQQTGEDSGLNAADDPHNALDAAILLLIKDDSVYGKYSSESIAALQRYYGDHLDTAVSTVSGKLSRDFEARLGAPPHETEIAEVIKLWFASADYSVKGAEISGNSAKTTVTTSSAVDVGLLGGVAESELTKRVAEKPTILLMKKDDQIKWAVEMLTEIVKNPKQFGIVNGQPTDTVITMRNASGTGWVVDNPDAIINCLIRGIS